MLSAVQYAVKKGTITQNHRFKKNRTKQTKQAIKIKNQADAANGFKDGNVKTIGIESHTVMPNLLIKMYTISIQEIYNIFIYIFFLIQKP